MTDPTCPPDPTGGVLRRSILTTAAHVVHHACCQDHALDQLVALGADDPRPDDWPHGRVPRHPDRD